ncbi:glycoprotease [Legionella geestiana]|uniref:tRNA threonylcarbamoyladenosine biosynthesis protein TsaB n=1 Tax=Legionella geestiana TaxID=45065 RepID=A0A0W0U3P5_9GAMM|nr:tRNA (adenosine(37)-N6)-threonylcarbamoyltransferase complex dimerization subunit type 1 TsaB [Legionella geestiana]KTD02676.1 glycoprotease [Legionella geestiana]STX54804.1 glycoprotease [Legionella geestiana]
MKLLAIETSTSCASVALTCGGACYVDTREGVAEHARFLLPMVERLLQEADMRLETLDGIVFGQGPGSFTGIRIACAVAKGLAFAADVPLYPVSTLRAMAGCVDTPTLVLLDARMNQLYWAVAGLPQQAFREQVSNAENINVAGEMPLEVVGFGFEPYRDALAPALRARILSECSRRPDAELLIARVREGEVMPVSAAEALPVYIRDNVTHGAKNG